MKNKIKIGFIGQGWIGKNYADDFEKRGFDIIRYSQEEPYIKNKNKIKDCDIVFIAVPTPTTPKGFDLSAVKEVIKLVRKGKIAVLKSTIFPGSTEILQGENPDICVLHSPEFLTEATAAHDAGHPDRNIVGISVENEANIEKAKIVLAVLPKAPYNKVCSAREAELIKYGGNCFFYTKVVFMNLLYDLAEKLGCDWDVLREVMSADPRIGKVHMNPVHKGGRGGGGHCFIKDFFTFVDIYKKYRKEDKNGLDVLLANEKKNIELLISTNKSLDLLAGVYGKAIMNKNKKVK